MSHQPEPVLLSALGREFEKLHPMLQRQYSITSEMGVAGKGSGIMNDVTHGAAYTIPFLHLGARRLLLFPETGKNVPFTVENYAYVDRLGRETLTWTRSFAFDKERRFDEYLTYSKRRGGLVVYAGSHQHLAVDLKAWVDQSGALCFATSGQRLYEFPIGIPFPRLLSGVAQVRESYDDEKERYEIEVSIDNRPFGHIFGYSGWFHHELHPCPEIPPSVLPRRTEVRD